MNANELVTKLHWLGHDSFRLEGPPVIYFDPWKLSGKLPKADLLLVSHEHHDHCSPEDVEKIRGPETVIVAAATAAKQLPGARAVRPGDRLTVAGVEIEAVRAYNLNKFRSPGVPFHPREAEHVGFVVTVDGVRIYHAGDTDHIPEMAEIDCDVALLPVSGKYVMTVEEAAEAAKTLSPAIVVPMHYGSGIGTADDGRQLTKLYDGDVVLLEKE
ncbi:MAG: MBL fold metallo-hydrolase [Anaerolineae bacterium]|jgi:L-ascorbate metabolism protein UlaG (beta-lactamase superfamily)